MNAGFGHHGALLRGGGGNFDSSRTEAVLVSVHLRHDELRHEELQACIDEIIALGRTIIWHEWGRVKRGI